MKTTKLLEALKNKPVFNVQDVERIAYCNKEYARLILNRLEKKGFVKRVVRNTYTTKDNIFVIASNITYPSYISFWSASYFLGYTEQIINKIQVATTRRIKAVKFEGYEIKFIPLKHFFGYKKINTTEGEMFIVDGEKLLLDAFLKPEECGNLDEIEKIFENAKVDKEKIIKYLKLIRSQTVIKRVGFFLDKIKGIDISKSFKLDKNYPSLDPFNVGGKINRKWRVKE